MKRDLILHGGYSTQNIEQRHNYYLRLTSYVEQQRPLGPVMIVTSSKRYEQHAHLIDHIATQGFREGTDFTVVKQGDSTPPDWGNTRSMFIVGGNQVFLFNELVRLGCTKEILEGMESIHGDSAGAMIMGSKYYFRIPEIGELALYDGFGLIPVIVIPHFGDKAGYDQDILNEIVEKFGDRGTLEFLTLREEEVVINDLSTSIES